MQLTMNDNDKLQQTFLYKLSEKPGLQWFKKIVLLGSHQDLYVPYYSARIQKHKQSIEDSADNVRKGEIYCNMVNNILKNVNGNIIRLDVNFCIPEQYNFSYLEISTTSLVELPISASLIIFKCLERSPSQDSLTFFDICNIA